MYLRSISVDMTEELEMEAIYKRQGMVDTPLFGHQ